MLLWNLDISTFVYGSGKEKSKEQRHYEHLTRLSETSGIHRKNSTFVVLILTAILKQINQLPLCASKRITWAMIVLPAYNVQIGVADEYIAVVDVNHYRSDMGTVYFPRWSTSNKLMASIPSILWQMLDMDF